MGNPRQIANFGLATRRVTEKCRNLPVGLPDRSPQELNSPEVIDIETIKIHTIRFATEKTEKFRLFDFRIPILVGLALIT